VQEFAGHHDGKSVDFKQDEQVMKRNTGSFRRWLESQWLRLLKV